MLMFKKQWFILLLCPLLFACKSSAYQSKPDWEISEVQAKSSVFAALDIDESEFEYIKVNKAIDNGKNVYQIHLRDDDNEYFYYVHRHNGEILSSTKQKIKQNEEPVQQNEIKQEIIQVEETPQQTPTEQEMLTRDQILSMITKKVPGINTSSIELELDKEDGKLIYEGEFIYNQLEYEFEINALNGTFLKWSIEQKD